MSLTDFGIITGSQHYSALRFRYLDGLNWIRRCIGTPADFENGIPLITNSSCELKPNPTVTVFNGSIVDTFIQERLAQIPLGVKREHFVEMDEIGLYPITNEGEGIAYSAGVYSLDEPWGDMLSSPYHDVNREISRFAGSHDSPDYNPLTESKKLLTYLVKKVKEMIEAREETIKKNNKEEKEEGNKPSLKDVGFATNFDTSEAAMKARLERIMERRRDKENEKIKESLSCFAFGEIIENADIGYLLLILTSNDIGLTHPDESVREGALNIIMTLPKIILTKSIQDISENITTIDNPHKENNREGRIILLEYTSENFECKTYKLSNEEQETKKSESTPLDETISLIHCIWKAINIPHYGVNDRDEKIRIKAQDLDNFLIDTGIRLKALQKQILTNQNVPLQAK